MTIKQLYPTQRPALDLNFARQKRLDPRVTFTRGSTATYVGSDGLIKTAADDEARFDYDPVTGESLGLLLEAEETNLVTNSEVLTSYSNLTVTSDAATAPDGNLTADKLIPNTTNANHISRKSATTSNTNQHTFSLYAKADGYNFLHIRFSTNTTVGGPIVSLITGEKTGFSGSDYDVESFNIGNSWWRFAVTFTPTAAATTTIDIYPCETGTSTTFPGDGTSGVLAWGAQLEESPYPTSYIPTSGATITRAADTASITGTNFSSWYNQSEGTIYTEFAGQTYATGGTTRIISFADDDQTSMSSGNGILFGSHTGGLDSQRWRVRGSSTTNFSLATGTVGSTALAYAPSDLAMLFDGGAVESSTNSAPTALDRLNLFPANAPISRFAYYPTRLPDTQLQALTL
jgi:hypothetical protein